MEETKEMQENVEYEYTIIGTGTFGTVIHPAILCNKMELDDPRKYVSKILPISSIPQEEKSFNNLPDELDKILYFKECNICDINESNQFIFEKLKINTQNKMYINMRFIPGKELHHIIEKYKNEDNQTNQWNESYENRDNIPEIPRNILFDLLFALRDFYKKIEVLNNIPYYHNDISSTNIIYDNNTFYLIDFGMSNKQPFMNTNLNYDKNQTMDVLSQILSTVPYISNNKEIMEIYKYFLMKSNNKSKKIQFTEKDILFKECLDNLILSLNHTETSGGLTPLKISIRTADEISTKLPVTDLEQAPRRGAVSNLHRYKKQKKTQKQLNKKTTLKKSKPKTTRRKTKTKTK
jgi:hypothetical protein